MNCHLNNHKEALKFFNEALKIHPKNPLIHFHIGSQWGQMGIYDLMVETYEELYKVIYLFNICSIMIIDF